MRTVIDRDNGVQTIVDLSSDGSLTTGTVQDCSPIAERMKAMHNEGFHVTQGGDKFAGSIPDVMVEKYCTDRGITFSEFMGNREHVRNIMNDPAMAHFRVWKGRL